MKVLTFTSLFPNNVDRNHGVFVKERMFNWVKREGCELKVIAPVLPEHREILDGSNSVLVERDPDAIMCGITEALDKRWDREGISQAGQKRTWHKVAEEVDKIFETCRRNENT